jgi:4-nitrophenyl phosphatase
METMRPMEWVEWIADVEVVLCDLDGVVWLDRVAIPGAADAIGTIRESGRRVVFVTNNSAATRAEQCAALRSVGIDADGDVVSSADAAAQLVPPGRRVLVTGGAGIVEALRDRGAVVVAADGSEAARSAAGDGIDVVVAGIDRAFDFARLSLAAGALRDGAAFVATNLDATFPTPSGLIPGAGAIVAALTVAGGVAPVVAGKPHRPMVDTVVAHVGMDPAEAPRRMLVVGDRLDSDGAFAATIGCRFALVRSGVTTPDAVLPDDPPVAIDRADLASIAGMVGSTGRRDRGREHRSVS